MTPAEIKRRGKEHEMTTETITIYAVNETGLAELRDYLEANCNHPVTDSTVRAYAEDLEQSMTNNNGVYGHAEIRGFHSKTGNPIPFSISDEGWNKREEEI